jgi:hypothetical protein
MYVYRVIQAGSQVARSGYLLGWAAFPLCNRLKFSSSVILVSQSCTSIGSYKALIKTE